jgi:hypothetical protein
MSDAIGQNSTIAGLTFPVASYLLLQTQSAERQKSIQRSKESWLLKRQALTTDERLELDMQFKVVFERLEHIPQRAAVGRLQQVLLSLEELAFQGASASKLDTYELAGFNVASAIIRLSEATRHDELDCLAKIIKLAILADADVQQQRAYSGNGGAPALHWLCNYIGGGLESFGSSPIAELQFACCYDLFVLIANSNLRFLTTDFTWKTTWRPGVQMMIHLRFSKSYYCDLLSPEFILCLTRIVEFLITYNKCF